MAWTARRMSIQQVGEGADPARSGDAGDPDARAIGLLAAPRLPKAQARAAIVLRAMVETGAITQAQADAAKQTPAVISDRATVDARNFYLDTGGRRSKLRASHNGIAPNVDLIVHTNLEAQDPGSGAQQRHPHNQEERPKVHASQAAVVVMKPDGAVVALVGRTTMTRAPSTALRRRIASPAPPSSRSSYLAALESVSHPGIPGRRAGRIDGWTPTNFGGRAYGTPHPRQCAAHSVNNHHREPAQEVGVRRRGAGGAALRHRLAAGGECVRSRSVRLK